jgi:hypothetical protein
MNVVTKWAYRVGLSLGAFSILASITLQLTERPIGSPSLGNRAIPEVAVSTAAIVFILLGFFLFFSAIRKMRENWNRFSPLTRAVTMWALIATNFFGGYIFFFLYGRIQNRMMKRSEQVGT